MGTLHPPHILQWKDLKGPDFQKIDPKKAVVLLTCSPLEVHGPHLPMATDIVEGHHVLHRAIQLFHPKYPDITYLQLPFLYTAADVVPQKGSIQFRCSTIIRVLQDIGRSLAKQGFRHIWVTSFHGGPRHFVSLEVACHRASRKNNIRMISLFSLLINRLTGGKNDLTDVLGHLPGVQQQDLHGDMHAGFVETSMMLHLLEEKVADNYTSLPRMTIDLYLEAQGQKPIFEGSHSPGDLYRRFKANLKFYETETYSGNPGTATAELGEQILNILAGFTAEALEDLWTEKLSLKECHTPLWPIRGLFLNPFLGWMFQKWVGYKSQIW